VFRDTVKRAASAAARTRIGANLIHAAILDDPGAMRFGRVERWPAAIEGFEDLSFLFSSNQLNHGIASLRLDEAALLYRVARTAGAGTLAEIGRFKGGSTLITACAMHPEAELWSCDLHVALRPDMPGAVLDSELAEALGRYGLESRVKLVVGDSRTVDLPQGPLLALFVDGDHSYEGARADFLRWRELLAPGASLMFHDAVDTGGYGETYPGIQRLTAEIARDDPDFERQADVGSIAHFTRRR
jgi:predicted O-methyltransferase YrrM